MSEPTRQQIKEAFKKTIERWEKIVVRPDYYYESDCKLCQVHEKYEGDKSCHRYCPIRSYGNHKVCIGTPHDAFSGDETPENALAELNFLRKVYIWWMEKEGKETFKVYGNVVKEEKKEEWVDVTQEIEWRQDTSAGGFYILWGNYHGDCIVHLGQRGLRKNDKTNESIKLETEQSCYTLSGKAFRILKKS